MDIDEWIDADGDGIGNNADAYPLDSSKWKKGPNYLIIGFVGALATLAIITYIGRGHT